MTIIYETHSFSTDNDLGFATGWNEGELSSQGRSSARDLRQRRLHDGIEAVFTSDLGRAVDTVKIAFVNSGIPVYFDSRLRECNYGDWNGAQVAKLASNRSKYIYERYPNGQSYMDVVEAMRGFLTELGDASWLGRRVLIVGHAATRWALDHLLNGVPLEILLEEPFIWRAGWQYLLPAGWLRPSK